MQRVGRFRLAALAVAVLGVFFSLLSGTWNEGVLGFALGAGVAVFGAGELARGADRPVALVLIFVGVVVALGELAQFILTAR